VIGLLAHQGGWDEALFVVVPMLVIIGLLWLAKRRADRLPQMEELVNREDAPPEPQRD
jgi:hypothetical protein